MNRIKIIKRANLQLPLEVSETDPGKLDAPGKERQAARAIGNWIDEWRASKTPDARRAFDELFGRPSATA